MTKLNIEQIDNLNQGVDNYHKTVETDRSILDRFNSAKKSKEGSASDRSHSQINTARKMVIDEGGEDLDINNIRSSYEEKLINTAARQSKL